MTLADVTHAIAGYVCGTRSRDSVVTFVESTKELSPATYVIALDAAIQAFEQAGPMDIALRLQNELMSFNRCRKFEEVELILGSSVQAAAEDVRRAERIEIEVDRKIECLLRIAVDQSVRAGADPARIFRVSKLAESFLQYSASPAPPLDVVSMAAKLIDVGTMVVPDDLLRKQRELCDGEREIAAKHAEFGAEILVNARLAVLQSCVPIVRYHHERWDGRGPCGLKGAAIPVGARLVSLCDTFDALCHRRPWRAALPIEQALLIIGEGAGSQFDPELAVRFIDWVRRLQSQVPDLDAYLGAEALDNDYVRMRDRIERLVHGPA
jgi:response regulator RpfG family c-di-GMP phosphodiesterase